MADGMGRETDYYGLPYDDFLKALEKEVSEQCKLWGVPEDYESVLELARETSFDPDFAADVVTLAEAVELIPEETLENELRLRSAEVTAVSSIAAAIDSRKLGERKIHGNIAELTQRAFRAGELYALLSQRKRQR